MAAASGDGGGTLVFSGPDATGRANMTVYTSKDSGASWNWLLQVDPNAGPGAYSSLAVINASHMGLAYEGKLTGDRAAGASST